MVKQDARLLRCISDLLRYRESIIVSFLQFVISSHVSTMALLLFLSSVALRSLHYVALFMELAPSPTSLLFSPFQLNLSPLVRTGEAEAVRSVTDTCTLVIGRL